MTDQARRNKAIRKCFHEQLGKGMPVMELYVMIGKQFYLSEERVRQIVAKRKSRLIVTSGEIHQQKRGFMCIFAADFGMNGLLVNSGRRGIPEENN